MPREQPGSEYIVRVNTSAQQADSRPHTEVTPGRTIARAVVSAVVALVALSTVGAGAIGAISGWWWRDPRAPLGVVASSFYVFSMLTPIAVAGAIALGVTVPCSALITTRATRGRIAVIWAVGILAALFTTVVLWWATSSVTLFIAVHTASWAGGVAPEIAEHYLWLMFDPATVFWSAVQTAVVVVFVVLAPLIVERRCGPAESATRIRRVRISAAAVLIVFGAAYAGIAVYEARVVPGYFGLT